MNKKKNLKASFGLLFFCVCVSFSIIINMLDFADSGIDFLKSKISSSDDIKIIATDEAKDIYPLLEDYAKTKGYNLEIEYCSGSIELIDRLNDGEKFDAVFLSNSLWM